MSNLSSLASFALALAALAACNKTNPTFCEGTDEQCAATDGPIDSPPMTCSPNGPNPECEKENPVCVDGRCTGQCTGNADCADRGAGEGVCHTSSGDCGACNANDLQDATNCPDPGNAVCDATDHTCRACTAHAECTSGICDDGRCALEAEVAVLATTGDDANPCTRAMPCLTVQRGIAVVGASAGAIDYLFLTPSATAYQPRADMNRVDINGVDVYILGTGATVERDGNGEVFDVHGGAEVTIDGLTITRGRQADGHAIKCETATLTVRDASLIMNAGLGISGSSCTLTMVRSLVSMNTQGGISLSGSDIKVSRSTISVNPGGGLQLSSGSFEIINNVITGNGNLQTASFAGLKVTGTSASKLEFNTVALNSTPAPLVDAIECIAPGVTARNNIVIGSTARLHTGGTCLHAYSRFTPDGLPVGGTMNEIVDTIGLYNFTSNTDFHIGAGSAAADDAQNTNLTGESAFDMDGQPRSGAMVDIGADEI